MTLLPLRSRRIAQTVSDGSTVAAFSLLEMMTVLALLLIFASFALPTYQNIVLRTREAALRDDLYTMRRLAQTAALDGLGSCRATGRQDAGAHRTHDENKNLSLRDIADPTNPGLRQSAAD